MTNRCLYWIKDSDIKYHKCRTKCPDGKYFCCEKHTPKNLDDMLECCDVCCNELTVPDLIVLKCNHVYHKTCYFKWLNKNNNNICPICNFSYKKHRKKERKWYHKNDNKKNTSSNVNTNNNSNDVNNEIDNNTSFTIPLNNPPTPPIDCNIFDTSNSNEILNINDINKNIWNNYETNWDDFNINSNNKVSDNKKKCNSVGEYLSFVSKTIDTSNNIISKNNTDNEKNSISSINTGINKNGFITEKNINDCITTKLNNKIEEQIKENNLNNNEINKMYDNIFDMLTFAWEQIEDISKDKKI